MLEKGAHPIAAKLFYDYLLSEEWQTKMGKEVEGLIPSRPGIRMKYDAQFRRDDIVFFPTENDVRDSDEFSDKFKAVGIP